MQKLRVKISSTLAIPRPNLYVDKLKNEFHGWALNEAEAPQQKGAWRDLFEVDSTTAVDLEIGTGNGFHFSNYALNNPSRCLLGLELKYKPLIQSITRALRDGAKNAKIARYDGRMVDDLFNPEELDKVFIHFPDPWVKKKHLKNRLITDEFLQMLFKLQKPQSLLEFKTDNYDYFLWAKERFERSPYKITAITQDLHNSEFANENFMTHFESIFHKQGIPINFVRLIRS
jgi:tRNA (guanine-N7-)-methyltransferase